MFDREWVVSDEGKMEREQVEWKTRKAKLVTGALCFSSRPTQRLLSVWSFPPDPLGISLPSDPDQMMAATRVLGRPVPCAFRRKFIPFLSLSVCYSPLSCGPAVASGATRQGTAEYYRGLAARAAAYGSELSQQRLQAPPSEPIWGWIPGRKLPAGRVWAATGWTAAQVAIGTSHLSGASDVSTVAGALASGANVLWTCGADQEGRAQRLAGQALTQASNTFASPGAAGGALARSNVVVVAELGTLTGPALGAALARIGPSGSGRLVVPGQGTDPSRLTSPPARAVTLDPTLLLQDLTAARHRLGLACIDLAVVKVPSVVDDPEDCCLGHLDAALGALESAAAAGHIQYYGVASDRFALPQATRGLSVQDVLDAATRAARAAPKALPSALNSGLPGRLAAVQYPASLGVPGALLSGAFGSGVCEAARRAGLVRLARRPLDGGYHPRPLSDSGTDVPLPQRRVTLADTPTSMSSLAPGGTAVGVATATSRLKQAFDAAMHLELKYRALVDSARSDEVLPALAGADWGLRLQHTLGTGPATDPRTWSAALAQEIRPRLGAALRAFRTHTRRDLAAWAGIYHHAAESLFTAIADTLAAIQVDQCTGPILAAAHARVQATRAPPPPDHVAQRLTTQALAALWVLDAG